MLCAVAEPGAAHDAGLRAGDRLIALDGHAVTRLTDVRLALWRRLPGDAVSVTFEHAGSTQQVMFALH